MELQFKEQRCACLDPVLREIQNLEQTQELKLSDGMPDVGRVLSAWGQTVLRSKEWRSESIGFSGGIMIWVLYAPEDGSQVRCLESWIPFQMQWELPGKPPEGKIRIQCMPRFVDARSVSARKIMVRCGIGAMAEAYRPAEGVWYIPEQVPEEVQLLRRTYPVRIMKEAGEKMFSIEEELSVPASVPQPEKLLYYSVYPAVTDRKVLADKVLFRGNLNLHILYISEEGQLHSWDFELPFSQFSELSQAYTQDAQANITVNPTNLELELMDEGQLQLKSGLTGQYWVDDIQMLDLVEDGYSPGREMDMRTDQMQMSTILENRRENLYGEQKLPEDAAIAVDAQFLPDFPRQQWNDRGMTLQPSGVFQVLYYAQDGSLQSVNLRWEGKMELPADGEVDFLAIPQQLPAEAPMTGSQTVKAELPLQLTVMGNHGLPMISGIELGQPQNRKEEGPSLILRRVGEEGLWPLAKASGSTVEAIRMANRLENDPQPGQMLLIPVR